ncbi:hypothetical protein [Rhodococcoides fascians]|uniref:hypothetical protein n=1 Tax=Rhodococcoides fascians TaxID=1828 RepID=UPI0012D2E337|nr:hypothetical protein [Rhodococcus fascians]
MTTSIRTNADAFAAKRQAFRENYAEMRSWGMTHEQIAHRMGIQRQSLLRRCARAGVFVPEGDEAALLAVLDQCIESGQPFEGSRFQAYDRALVGAVLNRALRQGRIQSVGIRTKHAGGRRTHIWCAVEARQSVAS